MLLVAVDKVIGSFKPTPEEFNRALWCEKMGKWHVSDALRSLADRRTGAGAALATEGGPLSVSSEMVTGDRTGSGGSGFVGGGVRGKGLYLDRLEPCRW